MITSLVAIIALFTGAAKTSPAVLASRSLPLNDRYSNTFVNDVFKDNILLTLNYMNGQVKSAKDVSWNKVEADAHYEFTLKPGEEFAFHDQVLPDRAKSLVGTTHAYFGYDQGFKSDGYLTGDGVCHLASLMYWAAKDANLEAYAPSNHNFAVIPDVPKEYGVAIYANPINHTGQMQNLYITNNKDKSITFEFDNHNSNLTLSIVEG